MEVKILMYTKLFEPWLLGSLRISNRIVLAPMGAHLGTEEGFASERRKYLRGVAAR